MSRGGQRQGWRRRFVIVYHNQSITWIIRRAKKSRTVHTIYNKYWDIGVHGHVQRKQNCSCRWEEGRERIAKILLEKNIGAEEKEETCVSPRMVAFCLILEVELPCRSQVHLQGCPDPRPILRCPTGMEMDSIQCSKKFNTINCFVNCVKFHRHNNQNLKTWPKYGLPWWIWIFLNLPLSTRPE